jgi:hypothetical protein
MGSLLVGDSVPIDEKAPLKLAPHYHSDPVSRIFPYLQPFVLETKGEEKKVFSRLTNYWG